ncbi:MAG: lipopolysaccharide biosynthesis protein [Bacteroidales bacterium]
MIVNYIKNIIKSEFNRNVFTLISGTTIAQLISIISSLVISRLYTPSDFGVFTLFISISSIFALLLAGRYELAINLPKSDKEGLNVLGLSFKINIIISIFLILLSFITFFVFDYFFEENTVFKKWLFFIPFVSSFLNIGNIIQNWFVRKKHFKLISYSKVINSIVNNGIAILLGLMTFGAWGIFLGNLFGVIASILFLTVIFYNYYKKDLNKINRKEMNIVSKKYIDLPKTNSFQSLIDAFQIQGITYLMAIFFSNTIIGLYAMTLRLLQAPLFFIITSITQVFYQKASEMYNQGKDIRPLIKNTIKKTLVIALPLVVLVMIFGPSVFTFVFGEQWREAGIYARILAPWIFLDFIRIPISQVPIIVGKQKKQLLLSLITNLIVILAMVLAGLVLHEIRVGLILISIFQSLYTLGIVIWIYRIAKF